MTKVDKYGRENVGKEDKSMKKFYEVEDGLQEEGKKFYDEDGKFKWEAESSGDDEEGDDEMSEEAEEELEEYDDEDEKVWNVDDGAELKEDIEVGKRLALTNQDWQRLTPHDIIIMFNSFCTGSMAIEKVEKYPSLYGLEQMKNDSLYGPPKDLFSNQKAKPKKKKKGKK